MPNGRFLQYYWQIHTLLSQNNHLLDDSHPDFALCKDYEVAYTAAFHASIVFIDGSRLIVRFSVRANADVEEYDYAYQYLDPQGSQVFRYDDAPHHPEVSTHPHHLHRGQEDAVYALDLSHVDFATVFSKIVSKHLAHLGSTNNNSA